jgi:hypothetical protein
MAQGFGKYLLKALGYGVFGVIFFGLTASAFASATLDLPRMDSNHDKVIQSHLAEVPQLSRHGLAFKPLCGRFQAIFSTTFGMIFGEVGSAKPKCASSSATDLSGRATRRRRS